MNFNSQVPHWLTKVKTYCAKVLPLVFDNSLSYYEFLCKMCHKLNEAIDAINAQNLNVIEFCHAVELEMQKFEEYMEQRQQDFEDDIKSQWETFKTEMQAAWEEFRDKLQAEWDAEKLKNEQFRQEMTAQFEAFKADMQAQQAEFERDMLDKWATYKATVDAAISQFEATVNADMAEFKTTMQTQKNEFEAQIVSLFNDFTTDQSQQWTDFQTRFETLFEQYKNQTTTAIEAEIQSLVDAGIAPFRQELDTEKQERQAADEEINNRINHIIMQESGLIFEQTEYTTEIADTGHIYYVDETTQEKVVPNLLENIPFAYYNAGSAAPANQPFTLQPNGKIGQGIYWKASSATIQFNSQEFSWAGTHDLGQQFFKVKKTDVPFGGNPITIREYFSTHFVAELCAYVEGDYSNTLANARPFITMYGPVTFDDTYYYIGAVVNIAAATYNAESTNMLNATAFLSWRPDVLPGTRAVFTGYNQ